LFVGDFDLSTLSILVDPHRPHYVYVASMNSEGFDPAREERVYLYSVEDVERSVPVLVEIKINSAEDATQGNVAMCRDGMKIQKAACGESTGG
jgi:hypothetical protein